MKPIVALCFAIGLLGCEQTMIEPTHRQALLAITKESLLANGFKQSTSEPEVVAAEDIPLEDLLELLGVTRDALKPTMNPPPDKDIRTIDKGGFHFIVTASMEDATPPDRPLDMHKAICSVSAFAWVDTRPKYAGPDGHPDLVLLKVDRRIEGGRRLEFYCRMGTSGHTPLAIRKSQLAVGLARPGTAIIAGFDVFYYCRNATFLSEVPDVITVSPSHPITFVIAAGPDADFREMGRLADMPRGEYDADLAVFPQRKSQAFDYHWQGEWHSKPLRIAF
jgi:hypothetical protein